MSQSEEAANHHTLPPPSYEEAMLGNTSANKYGFGTSNTAAPVHAPTAPQRSPPHYGGSEPYASRYSNTTLSSETEAPTNTPTAPPASQYPPPHYGGSEPYGPRYTTQQYPHTVPYMDSACPPGAEALRNLIEILVYPSKGNVYKIKDEQKVPLMTAKQRFEQECCCCDPYNNLLLFLRPLNSDVKFAQATVIMDSCECCAYSKRHLEVRALPSAALGFVKLHSSHRCTVENQSGDALYEVEQQSSCCDSLPYMICKPDGRQVGQIDYTNGYKHRMKVPKEMPVKHKLLLLFYTIYLQHEADTRNRSF